MTIVNLLNLSLGLVYFLYTFRREKSEKKFTYHSLRGKIITVVNYFHIFKKRGKENGH